jgi:hypothetical protein
MRSLSRFKLSSPMRIFWAIADEKVWLTLKPERS